MRIDTYKFPKSSFLSIEKDYNLLIEYILKNQRLLKLLYYPYSDALTRPDLTQEQIMHVIKKQIKIAPYIPVDENEKVYLVIYFTDFATSGSGTEYKDCTLHFDIMTHWDCYSLGDYRIRPIKIGAEIDTLMSTIRLNGMGKSDYMVATQKVVSPEFSAFTMNYDIVHMSEDNKNALNPQETQSLKDNFNKVYNEK